MPRKVILNKNSVCMENEKKKRIHYKIIHFFIFFLEDEETVINIFLVKVIYN